MPDVINPMWFVPAGLLIVGGLAGAVLAYLIQQRRARRLIARLRAVAADMEAEGYFQPDRDRRLAFAAYDIPDLHDVFEEETPC